MQLVINIPDEKYERLVYQDIISLRSYIENGIVIPKGHGRLIDADQAISKICGSACGCHLEECGFDKPCYSVTRIESASTIIEADRSEEE